MGAELEEVGVGGQKFLPPIPMGRGGGEGFL